MNAIFIVPFENGAPQFPGLAEGAQVGYCTLSYSPPPAGTPPYVLVEITATQAVIDTLTARPDCIFLCNIVNGAFDTAKIEPQDRKTEIVDKVATLFGGTTYFGQINAAIQAAQKRDELVIALATKAFFRHVNNTFMTVADIQGAGLNRA